MALVSVRQNNPATESNKKAQFENRLRMIGEKVPGIKKKDKLIAGYTLWRIFSDCLVVRAFKDYYTAHSWGDIDHYEYKRVMYKDVKYECDDLQFIANILEDKEPI